MPRTRRGAAAVLFALLIPLLDGQSVTWGNFGQGNG
jgi:hypothetical protein